jgi:hypothetical protein
VRDWVVFSARLLFGRSVVRLFCCTADLLTLQCSSPSGTDKSHPADCSAQPLNKKQLDPMGIVSVISLLAGLRLGPLAQNDEELFPIERDALQGRDAMFYFKSHDWAGQKMDDKSEKKAEGKRAGGARFFTLQGRARAGPGDPLLGCFRCVCSRGCAKLDLGVKPRALVGAF